MEATLSTFGSLQLNETAPPDTSNTNIDNTGQLNEGGNNAGQGDNNQPTADTTGTSGDNSTPPAVNESETDFNLSIAGDNSQPNATPAEGNNQQSQAPQTFNWKDEIKKVDRKEALKELGLNDFAIELNDHITRGGNPADYLHARSVDYNKISDEDLIKSDLKAKYPNFTPDEISRMYNRKYGVNDTMSDEEKEDVSLEAKAQAYHIRESKIAEQQKFKVPDAIVLEKDEAYEQWKQNSEQNTQIIERMNQFYNSHEATKTLNENKRVTINLGDGVKPFTFKVDKPELITKSMLDGGETYLKLALTDKGEPDVARQQLVSLFAFNPSGFIQTIFNYGKSMGVHGKVAEGQNATKPNSVLPASQPSNGQQVSVKKFGDIGR
jgi:hypothetical protein